MLERKDTGGYFPVPDDGVIVCRCEEITKGEIRRAIHDGFFALAEIRRFLRAGMGLCQGQTCGRLVKALLARELGIDPAAVEPETARSPVRPVEMRVLADNQERSNG
jgi:NAD(P)H-nitrite reductase large subunit